MLADVFHRTLRKFSHRITDFCGAKFTPQFDKMLHIG